MVSKSREEQAEVNFIFFNCCYYSTRSLTVNHKRKDTHCEINNARGSALP